MLAQEQLCPEQPCFFTLIQQKYDGMPGRRHQCENPRDLEHGRNAGAVVRGAGTRGH